MKVRTFILEVTCDFLTVSRIVVLQQKGYQGNCQANHVKGQPMTELYFTEENQNLPESLPTLRNLFESYSNWNTNINYKIFTV